MPVEKTIKLYTFKELNENTRDDIISNYLQDLPCWWSDDVEERIRNEASSIGIEDFDFSWSGFWSQGDGLSFTGSLNFKSWLIILAERLNPTQFAELGEKSPRDVVMLQESKRINWGDCRIERETHQYVHENSVSVTWPNSQLCNLNNTKDPQRMQTFGDGVKIALNEWKDELCNKWYSELQEAYEAHTTRDNIVENIMGHDHLFTSTGIIIDDTEQV